MIRRKIHNKSPTDWKWLIRVGLLCVMLVVMFVDDLECKTI